VSGNINELEQNIEEQFDFPENELPLHLGDAHLATRRRT
jgi:hypothetical protein